MDKPQIKLNPLEKTAIKVPTEKIAKELMRIFEIGGLNWRNGKVPDGIGFWKTYKEDSCVGFEEDKILYSSKGWFDELCVKTISAKKYYKLQPEVTKKKRAEINAYFESLK